MSLVTRQPEHVHGPRIVSGGDPGAIGLAAAALRAGAVIAIPTDTVYGLAAAIDRPDAIDRLFTLKGRSTAKAIPVLLSEFSDIELVAAQVPDLAMMLAQEFWPGALTLVIPTAFDLPSPLTSRAGSGERTIAVRVPDHALARSIIAAAGGALAVTSANRSGEAPALEPRDILDSGGAGLDFVVDGGRAPGGIPSTIVLVVSAAPEVLRAGAISDQQIAAALRSHV